MRPSTVGPQSYSPYVLRREGLGRGIFFMASVAAAVSRSPRVVRRKSFEKGPALHDRAMKQAFSRRHCHKGKDFSTPAGLTEDSDVARIAPESCDVVANPL